MEIQPEKLNEDPLKRDEKGRLLPGTPPGPGRPRGSVSIKDKVREHLESHPEDVQEIVAHFVKTNRELMWQMLEGKPKQQMEVDVDKDTLGELTQFFRAMAKSNDNSKQKGL